MTEERTVADKPTKPIPTVKTTNARNSDIQRRAQAMVSNRKPVSAGTFLKEAWIELKKTTWPTKPVLIKSTSVVLALVFAVGIWVAALGAIFNRILTPIFNGVIK